MRSGIFYTTAVIALVALIWLTWSARQRHEERHGPLQTDSAPKPIGPYSQAVMRGNALFVSGQIAIDPATGQLDTSDIKTETHRIMKNIRAIISNAGLQMNDIAKATIYLTDLSHFQDVNSVYAGYFGNGPYPARETVEVSALPKGAHVEISVTAIR